MDWIETFVSLTEGLRSPVIFRRWSAIATIAGVLQRRVWTELKTGTCYTNLYIMLTGGPGSGKTLPIIETRKLWGTVQGLHIGPDNPTKPALIKRLSLSTRTYVNGKTQPTTFCSLAVPCEEFGVLITKYDIEFLAMLSHIWNNPGIYDVPRAAAESFLIDKPNMNIIAGVQPDTLGATFPEVAWGQGFTARCIFIYSEKKKFSNKDMFQRREDITIGALAAPLASMFDLGGEMPWEPETMSTLIDWLDEGMVPVPEHNRLKFYIERRTENFVKLAMISAVSLGRFNVTLDDFDRARTWLLEAEQFMPDVFRAMAQRSDIQEVADLHEHIHRLWRRREIARRQPIDDEILWAHLADRVPSERIPRIIELAERGGWISREKGFGPRRWIPRPINEINTKIE